MLIVFGSAKVPINLKIQSNSIRIRLLHKLRVPHLRTLNIHQYSAKHPPANPFILFYSKIVMKTPAFVHALLHWTLWFWRSPSHQNLTSITKDEDTSSHLFGNVLEHTLSQATKNCLVCQHTSWPSMHTRIRIVDDVTFFLLFLWLFSRYKQGFSDIAVNFSAELGGKRYDDQSPEAHRIHEEVAFGISASGWLYAHELSLPLVRQKL